MAKLKYINSNNKSIVLGNTKPFVIISVDGLGSPENAIYTQKSPFQDGVTVTGSTLEFRNIVIEGKIIDRNRVNRQAYRNRLLQAFNPKLDGKLIYESVDFKRQIECKVEQAPYFASNSEQSYQDFSISLIAPSPFWKDIKESSIDLVTWIPNLEFDAVEGFSTEQAPNYWIETAPEGEGFEEFESGFGTGSPVEFGYRLTRQIVEIDNIGDVEAPIRVVFRAHGEVAKPYIQNIETYELLRINKTLQAGDVLEITTEFGNKNVYLNGEKAHHYLDYINSTWLQLKPGINLIKYGAESGTEVLECRLYFTPRYLGV